MKVRVAVKVRDALLFEGLGRPPVRTPEGPRFTGSLGTPNHGSLRTPNETESWLASTHPQVPPGHPNTVGIDQDTQTM